MNLKIMLKSAQVFKSVTPFSKMQLYAVATVVDGPSSSPPQTTTADMHGGAKPFWWFPVEFDIGGESKLVTQDTDAAVVIRIKSRRKVLIGSDKSVGVVEMPVKALLEKHWLNSEGNQPTNIALTILSRSGKPRGVLYLSYMFADDENMYTAPAPPFPPRCVQPVPSAPPLQHCEDHYYYAPIAVVPSAPYLSQNY